MAAGATAAAAGLLGSGPRDVVTSTASLAGRAAGGAAQVPGQVVATAQGLTRSGRRLPGAVYREAADAAGALLDLRPERARRRVWTGQNQAQIEVRGMTGSGTRHRRLASGVTRRLGRLRGVRWAEVNAVTGQVLVAFDERRVDVGSLLEVVRDVEEAHGTREENFPWSRPVHPADPTPIAAATLELACDYLSMTVGVVGRVTRLPTPPRGLRAAQALLEVEPALRRRLKRRIGPIGTDVVLALTAATLQGLSHGPGAPAVDALYRLELLLEALSRRAVWNRRVGELCCTAETLPTEAPVRPPRPRPRPDGPIEAWAERLGPGALGAAGAVLALTRDPARAADTIIATVPKAARVGREGFATTVGGRLARHGVVPLNSAAWRRLDRISAIVLDSAVLCSRRPQILAAEPAAGTDVATVWQVAGRVLADLSVQDLDGDGPWRHQEFRLQRLTGNAAGDLAAEPGSVLLDLKRGNRRLGRITVGSELHPHAEALVDAARSSGARVLVTRNASAAELLPRVDEVLAVDVSLADHVLRLQREGHGVLVVSDTADQALAVADVGVAVLDGDGCVCWSADLLCGPGLTEVWRILRLVAPAERVSGRAVQLAQAGSSLGVLLALVGRRRPGGRSHLLPPVHAAALVALVQGTLAGLRVTGGAAPPAVTHVPWHAMDGVDVLARLDEVRNGAGTRSPTGWAATARWVPTAAGRVYRLPPVAVALAPARGAYGLSRAVRQELHDPLTPVLAVGAAASAVVGSGIDALLVTAVVSGNALVSGVQRVSAERAMRRLFMEQEVLARRLRRHGGGHAPEVTVTGLESAPLETVPNRALGPGDIIALRASDVVPADARLLYAADLEVDESTLTGESVPVGKDTHATPAAPLAERGSMVFQGTTVLAGAGYAVVVATGDSTEAGRASRAAGRKPAAVGIQARLGEVTRRALPATGFGGMAVTGLALLRGLPLRQAVAAGVSIAVAAVPEGLPLVATVSQAAAARRLSRRGVLVRSSRTLEALGRVDVVCFDKTGTLTEGRLKLTRFATLDGDVEPSDPAARQLLLTAARACPQVNADDIAAVPHATDRAVLDAAQQYLAEQPGSEHLGNWKLQAELPFETNRGYAASLGWDDETVLAVKGAPEVVLPLCGRVADGQGGTALRPASRTAMQRTAQRLAGDGLRVLAVAERRENLPEHAESVDDLVDDLVLVGFVGVADAPRPVAAEAVRRMRDAGVQPVMITGDHPLTAAAIAEAVGITAGQVLTGADLDRMTEPERVARVPETTVFARVSPEQKLRIVEAFQSGGHVVAMTGDGTNDAAAIRLADVGVGVGAAGSSSARSAADLVLVDADIRRLYDALLEGRGLWRRVRDAVAILVGGNAGEVAFMVLGTAMAGRAPINVRQLLLVNMFTDMFPALAVAVASGRGEAASSENASAALATPLARAVMVRGAATTCGALLAWMVGRYTGRGRRASSMGLAALVATQLGQTLLTGWRSPLVVATAAGSAAALFVLIETPGVSQFFGCTPIGPAAWGIVLLAATVGTVGAAVAPRLLPALAAPAGEDAATATT